MTKKKAGASRKRVYQTAHQRAMTNPEAREALNALRVRWSDLSPKQRGEQLKVLIGFGCTQRGIADDLGQPPTTIRTYINAATDWIADMEDAWAEDPEEQSARIADQYPCRFPAKIPAKKIVEPAANETRPVQDHARNSTAKQAKEITPHLLKKIEELPVANCAVIRQEGEVGEDAPKTGQVDAYMKSGQSLDARIQRLATIDERIKSRPIYTARSMKRQGRPEPPTDPHRPVS